ncbi:TetR/AcrR family transcriptional regulator [Microbacterium marinilacus]|uniref:HTH tetR-type domain-containing protein n=1 Tax=Microbacterium marinilacus TaxID=415209 RepID=A0ABP7B6Y6_9MICO|nr:TetR/AcrR family transcriptional regulator [Microbacterium marinilacus]MBY0687447.1 TetR/AcrR family transcriptional regulator [Microbacterium marinilacus]
MPTPTRRPRRDALANREAILSAAAAVMRRDPDASIDAVASAAGLSRRSVYGHFASRDELLTELASRGAARIAEALADVGDDDPAVHVAKIGSALWTEVAHVKLVARMVVGGPLEHTVARGLEPIRASLRAAVSRGVERGVFRADADVQTVSRLIERQALDVLDEVVRQEADDAAARRLVIVMALGIAGLSWRDAAAVADAVGAEPRTSVRRGRP